MRGKHVTNGALALAAMFLLAAPACAQNPTFCKKNTVSAPSLLLPLYAP